MIRTWYTLSILMLAQDVYDVEEREIASVVLVDEKEQRVVSTLLLNKVLSAGPLFYATERTVVHL